jgi:hypothetical protein
VALSLDAEDGNPRSFLTNLVAALHAAEPRWTSTRPHSC